MKKIMIGLMVLTIAFCGRTQINESLDNAKVETGYQFLQMNAKGQEVDPNSSISWYLYNASGYSVLGIDYMEVSSGNATTINMQPIFKDKTNAGAVQTLTYGGTAITNIHTDYLCTYYNNVSVTSNVTFNFVIAE